jgi:phthiocerol/phenolphthiocerol synthesis type-I polyketide synthase E
VYPVALSCSKGDDASAKQVLDDVHNTLNAVPHYGIGYGLLRYLYAPTARLLDAARPADIFFSYVGTIPDLPSLSSDAVPVQIDADTALPVREPIPGLGHAIEFRVYRSTGVLNLHWWYDTRRVEPGTAQSLADGFAQALMELIHEATTQDEIDSTGEELTLVDLSSSDIDLGEANAEHR